MSSLQPMVKSGQLTILKPLVFPRNNIIELQYTPAAPNFTIRTIIEAIASSKPSESSFHVSIYRPPSLEERARRMYVHEQRTLLFRLVFAIVVAIPTFVIGVVYMSLVPHDNLTRMWFMSPLWTGNASRVEWALFLLATPVYFYSCGLFHRRCVSSLGS
jgi:P-type Cu+ transporter